jgi:hypothetical protein
VRMATLRLLEDAECVRFENLTAVTMKSTIFWGITPLQSGRSPPTNILQPTFCFLLQLFFDPEDGGSIYHRNIGGLLSDYEVLHPRRQYSSRRQGYATADGVNSQITEKHGRLP